jgi:hypothetical protein
MRPGLLRGTLGLIIGGAVVSGLYIVLRLLTGNPMAWEQLRGAMFMFGGIGAAAGWILGVGGFSPGASAHEGPVVTYLEQAQGPKEPGPAQLLAKNAVQFVKWAVPLVIPNIRTMGIALGWIAAITAFFLFIGANPIVRVTRTQTFNDAANTSTITGDKFLIFVIVTVVIIGGLVTTAFAISLIMASVSRQVEVAKKMKVSRLPDDSPLLKLGRYAERVKDFTLAWVRDMIEGFRGTVVR